MLDGLAFLPIADVPEGMQYIRDRVPDIGDDDGRLADLIDYFDSTYVSGSVQRITRQTGRVMLRLRRNPPLFPADNWNVHDVILSSGTRTNNFCESWNNGFRHLVGQSHPSVWIAIQSFQEDEATASANIKLVARGKKPEKRVSRRTTQYQERLHNLCRRRHDGQIGLDELLRGVGHTIRMM